jgi:hypothetical protein
MQSDGAGRLDGGRHEKQRGRHRQGLTPPLSFPHQASGVPAGGLFLQGSNRRLDFATIGCYLPVRSLGTERCYHGRHERSAGNRNEAAATREMARRYRRNRTVGDRLHTCGRSAGRSRGTRRATGQPDAVTLQVDNDLFGAIPTVTIPRACGSPGCRRRQGTRLGARWRPSGPWHRCQGSADLRLRDRAEHVHTGGHLAPRPRPTDRPTPAGFTRRSASPSRTRNRTFFTTSRWTSGSSGHCRWPSPQKMWHEFIDSPTPHGWSHQLDNEPASFSLTKPACGNPSPLPLPKASRSTSRRRPGWP